MKFSNALFFLLMFLTLGIQYVHATSVKLLEYSWVSRLVTEYYGDSTEMSRFILNSLDSHLPEFIDEQGNHISHGATSVYVIDHWSDGLLHTYLEFRIKTSFGGMFTSNGIMSSHAINIIKQWLSLITSNVKARSDVNECYPLISKIWEGISFEPDIDFYIINYSKDGSILSEFYYPPQPNPSGPLAQIPFLGEGIVILVSAIAIMLIRSRKRL